MNNFLQKKNIMASLACMLIIAAACIIGVNAANSKVRLVMNKITSDEVKTVEFKKSEYVWIDDTIFVPLRKVCNGAGFSLEWNDETRSARVTLNANSDTTPVEKFCSEFLTAEKCAEAMVHNKSISVEIPVDSCDVKLFYNYSDQNNEDLIFEYIYQWNVSARILKDGTLLVPLKSVIETFGLNIDWDSKNNTATVSIPDVEARSFEALAVKTAVFEENAAETDTETVIETVDEPTQAQMTTEAPLVVSENIKDTPKPPASTYSSAKNYTVGKYIGRFKVTHYCICSRCNGRYGNSTAYGGAIRPGITIAVDPRVIKKLSWVYIDGYGVRLAEDVGGAIKGNRIDMAVADHKTAMAMGVKYCDVWYADISETSSEVISSPTPEVTGENNTPQPLVESSPVPDSSAAPTTDVKSAEASPSQTQEASVPATTIAPDNAQNGISN